MHRKAQQHVRIQCSTGLVCCMIALQRLLELTLKSKAVTIHAPMHCSFPDLTVVVNIHCMPTSNTLVVPGMPAKVTLHCTSALLLVHQVVPAKLTLWTVTADEPMVMGRSTADLPPKELAMVAVPADRGRSLLSRVELPKLAISLAKVAVAGVTLMVVEVACTCTGGVGCLCAGGPQV